MSSTPSKPTKPPTPPKTSTAPTTSGAHNETLLATQQMKTAYPPLPQQQKACLHELHEVMHGRQAFLTTTPENPASARRPPSRDLEERGLLKPGLARATQAASVEMPWGSPPDGPNYQKMGNLRTVMQQHVDFFDRNNDGVITMLDTFLGFRRLGFNWAFSLWAVFVVNPAFSLMTSPGWLPDPFFCIYSRNVHRGKHGSDQEVYDTEGRFIPQKFEDMFSKFDHDKKGGLSFRDLWEMTQSTFETNDFFGWFAGKFEWGTLWLLTADERGLVTKEAVRSVYDGSLFYKMEAKWWHGQKEGLGEYAHMGEGATFPAIWARLWGKEEEMNEKAKGMVQEQVGGQKSKSQ